MNKFLKVISAALISAAVAVSTAVSVSAVNANEHKILHALNGTVSLNGVLTKIPTEYYNQAENYFNRSDVELTANEATQVIEKINAVKAYLETTNVSKWSELSDAQIAQVVKLSNDASGVVGVKLEYSRNAAVGKKVTVVTSNGNGSGNGSQAGDTSNPIKQTGFEVADVTVVAGLGILLVTAAGVYLLKTSKKDEVR